METTTTPTTLLTLKYYKMFVWKPIQWLDKNKYNEVRSFKKLHLFEENDEDELKGAQILNLYQN